MKISRRFLIGFKKGLLTPNLPEHVLDLQNNPYIRILRVTGGISIILILTHKLDGYAGNGLLYIICLWLCAIISIMFTIYLLYVSYHRIIYIYKNFNSDKLDVRNSPLDKFAGIISRIVWCSKGFCDVAAPIGVAYGSMAAIDELRKIKGLEPMLRMFTIFS